MASAGKPQSCLKCEKSQGQVTCGECGQCFCVKHLLEHRQDLSGELEKCIIERDQLQENLDADENDR